MKEEKIVQKSETALKEEQILEFWEQNKIFEKSVAKVAPKGNFVFFEGPPTANGVPGIHHVLARSFKDVIPRFKTMQGYHVDRKAGWDTHGLPVELQVEKELGISGKQDIEKYGVEEFNKKCKESVWRYLEDWQKLTKRIAYWVDLDHPYVTYENNYIESLWWVIKEIKNKNLLYKGYKVVPHCTRCGTALSSHEVAQGYKLVTDNSVYLKFKVTEGNNPARTADVVQSGGQIKVGDFILAWTTTPWTLPGNVALAVGEKIDYVRAKMGSDHYILAKARIALLGENDYSIEGEFKGSEMLGISYEPLFDIASIKNSGKKAYFVAPADFVTTTDGTGVVHTAVMYGEDDYNLGEKIGLPKIHTVDEKGKFIDDLSAYGLAGMYVKGKETESILMEYLGNKGFLFEEVGYEHDYPFCWRCDTPLLYYAKDSWFIRTTGVKEKLIANNQKINWIPSHIRDGRFGEWINNIKDWGISRERYWGTPIPVWECDKCENLEVLGSIEELKKKTKKNNFYIMRHGESESLIEGVFSSGKFNHHKLTEKGKEQVKKTSEVLKEKNIDLIVASGFTRTKETAEIVAGEIGYNKEKIIFNERLWEVNAGDFCGKDNTLFDDYFVDEIEKFTKGAPNGENYFEIKRRMANVFNDLNNEYVGKNILVISHGDPIWMALSAANGLTPKEAIEKKSQFFPNKAELKEIDFSDFPHNHDYELDLHKPYIDRINFSCSCGGEMKRVNEVLDCWFDSGAMPFAQHHYPFENKDLIDGNIQYPADYICEAIDQTRGWFYTLLAVSTLLDKEGAYKNVICLGHINDKNGKKMSKSKGNVINPWDVINEFGVDAVREHMFTINQPGEGKNYDLLDVREVFRKNILILSNVYNFYEMYQKTQSGGRPHSMEEIGELKNVLDIWINIKLKQLIEKVSSELSVYHIYESAREIPLFIDDLSTWYLRRSRDRFKGDDEEDKKEAIKTMGYILMQLSKVMAPFMPFMAEGLWQKVTGNNFNQDVSVHLDSWPEVKILSKEDEEVLENMESVREAVSFGLEARSKNSIKIRQPLAKITLKDIKLKDKENFIFLIKDELNIKEVVFDEKLEEAVSLDLEITRELKEEGSYRELVRFVQDLRKKGGLTTSDYINLEIETNEKGVAMLEKYGEALKKAALIKEITEEEVIDGSELAVDDLVFKVKVVK